VNLGAQQYFYINFRYIFQLYKLRIDMIVEFAT